MFIKIQKVFGNWTPSLGSIFIKSVNSEDKT